MYLVKTHLDLPYTNNRYCCASGLAQEKYKLASCEKTPCFAKDAISSIINCPSYLEEGGVEDDGMSLLPAEEGMLPVIVPVAWLTEVPLGCIGPCLAASEVIDFGVKFPLYLYPKMIIKISAAIIPITHLALMGLFESSSLFFILFQTSIIFINLRVF